MPMQKNLAAILTVLIPVFSLAQTAADTWYGRAEYLPGSMMATVMKKMAAEKRIQLEIDASGNVSGNLITLYNKSDGSISSETENQEFGIRGKYDSVKAKLLLVVTHIKLDSGAFIRFSKPDSIWYKTTVQRHEGRASMKAEADRLLNRNSEVEWVGSIKGKGMGMDISYAVNMHLLPLRLQLETDLKPPVKPVPVPETVNLAPRKQSIQQTIIVDTSFLQLSLYDNGVIDGDTVTLVLDGKVIIVSQPISIKPIRLDLVLPKEPVEHILELYANNLGRIPPNTALLVISTGRKRYEVNLSSNYDINAGVRVVVRTD
jgi:hypothetical protein